MAELRVGDIVIRRHRLLKTRGTVVRVAEQCRGIAQQVRAVNLRFQANRRRGVSDRLSHDQPAGRTDGWRSGAHRQSLVQIGGPQRSDGNNRLGPPGVPCPGALLRNSGEAGADCTFVGMASDDSLKDLQQKAARLGGDVAIVTMQTQEARGWRGFQVRYLHDR